VLSWLAAAAVYCLQIFECVTLAEILSNTWWHVLQVWVIIDQEQVWYPHWGTMQLGFLQDWDILSVNNFGFKIGSNKVGNVLPYNTYKKCISIFLIAFG